MNTLAATASTATHRDETATAHTSPTGTAGPRALHPRPTTTQAPHRNNSRPTAPRTAAGEAAALGTMEDSRPPQVTGPNAEPDTSSEAFDELVWRLQRAMWRITRDKTLAGCHRWRTAEAEDVGVVRRGKGGKGKFSGLQNSHSVWGSPLACLGISKARQGEMGDACNSWMVPGEEEHAVLMATLTISHRQGEGLEHLLKGLSEAWTKLISSRAYKGKDGLRDRYGMAHYAWFLEITHGTNGWHPHRHMPIMVERALSDTELEALRAELYEAWVKAVESVGLRVPNEAHGVDIQQAKKPGKDVDNMAAYVAKSMFVGLSAEVTGGGFKQARGGNRTPFQILADIADALDNGEKPDPRDVALWHEYERATKGKQQRRWSVGARDALNLVIISDEDAEDLADNTDGAMVADDEPTTLVAIPPRTWSRLSMDVHTRLEILRAANSGTTIYAGMQAVCDVLDRHGLEYRRVMTTHEHHDLVAVSARNSGTIEAQARAPLSV